MECISIMSLKQTNVNEHDEQNKKQHSKKIGLLRNLYLKEERLRFRIDLPNLKRYRS